MSDDAMSSGFAFYGAATSAVVTGIATFLFTLFLGTPICDEPPVFTPPSGNCNINDFDPSCLRYSPPQVCGNFFGFPPIKDAGMVATFAGLAVGVVGGLILFLVIAMNKKES